MLTCIFNKGGCSLSLWNKQVFKPQIQCIWGADECFLIFWPSSSWAFWCQAERCDAVHLEIFWGRKPWLVDAPDTDTKPKHSLTGAALQKHGQGFWDLQGTRLLFSPALFLSSSTYTVSLVVGTVRQHRQHKEKGILSLLRERHAIDMEAVTYLNWCYRHGKSYTDNKARIASNLRGISLGSRKTPFAPFDSLQPIWKPVGSFEKTSCERTPE